MKTIFTFALFLAVTVLVTFTSFAQSPSRESLRKEIESKRAELLTLETQILAPAQYDLDAYASFLGQPDTGLIRLLPRESYDSDVYRNVKKSLTIRGGGAYYSFNRRTHEYGSGSDISLQSGHLSVGFAGADFGMLTSLGKDVSLEELTLEHAIVQFISSYTPPLFEPDARFESRRFQSGLIMDGLKYASRLPAVVGTTYLLRSINYRGGDVLVGLEVIRKDTDGSLIIRWKLLNKYPVPILVRNN